MRVPALSLAALCVCAPVAAAQVEIGVFGQASYFDKTLGFDQGRGGPGVLLGFFPAPILAIEGEGSFTRTFIEGPGETAEGDITYIPLRARLVLNLPMTESAWFLLGGGYVHNEYRDELDQSDDGATGHIGFRFAPGPVHVRLGFSLDYLPSPWNNAKENWNGQLMAGLTYAPGLRRGPRDSDRDGVLDVDDRCADTPAGERVDASGCPLPKDADNDGVTDDRDQCAGTPAGDRVDANGCSLPKDADNDGVTDDRDRCAGTPAGDQVDANGCSLPKDADNDGVTDDRDQCANTPAGDQVDANGCSLPKDSDGDGVNDDRDRCPNTPSGVQVDASGCRVLFEERRRSLVLEGVNFETGKSELTPDSRGVLTVVAQSLVANDSIRVEVAGHTDNTGSAATNRRLSRARAEAVRQFLIDNGVSADRLTARGYGPSRPIAPNTNAEGRARNRRVELTRLN